MAGYGDDAGFTTWLSDNGYTLPGGAPSPAVLRQRGSGYVDGLGSDLLTGFTGDPTDPIGQERAWPRTGAFFGSIAIPADTVPLVVISSSYQAAYQEALLPGALAASGSLAQAVVRERVDVIEVQYQATAAGTDYAEAMMPLFTAISAALRPLMRLNIPRFGITALGSSCG